LARRVERQRFEVLSGDNISATVDVGCFRLYFVRQHGGLRGDFRPSAPSSSFQGKGGLGGGACDLRNAANSCRTGMMATIQMLRERELNGNQGPGRINIRQFRIPVRPARKALFGRGTAIAGEDGAPAETHGYFSHYLCVRAVFRSH
jgi:hypothetical protein